MPVQRWEYEMRWEMSVKAIIIIINYIIIIINNNESKIRAILNC